MASKQIHPPVALHSEGHEFLPKIDKYRGIAEAAMFDRLGRLRFAFVRK